MIDRVATGLVERQHGAARHHDTDHSRIGRAEARHQVEQRTGKACQRDQSGDNEP
jgi:hypothetical protein